MDDREKILGFKPQKENVYNKLLPYKDAIDEESNAVLADIKGNLGRSVELRDLKFGAGHWVGQLSKYIRLYGLKFSKEDHVALIHLLYELTVIPDLEMSLVLKFATQLFQLLKKKELLSREELSIPWRPLYKLMNSVMYSPYEHHGLQLFPSNIESTLKKLVKACRIYFPLDSVQEMLDEWRPLLCPFDVEIIKGLGYLDLFLPVIHGPEDAHIGYKLWFQELMDMWDNFQNNPSWENNLISLMSRLAAYNIGCIDWSPYVSKVFNRLLRCFSLPVGTQTMQVVRSNVKLNMDAFITWIVSMMGGGSKIQKNIDQLFKTLQTFYHPSNLGRWNIKLSSLLLTFPNVFIRRLHRERYQEPSWMRPIPDSHKLTDTEVTQFVLSMRSTVFMSMFSKYGSQDSAIALRHLSTMRPELVVPQLLEKMYPAMETLIEPHRLIACMNCIVSVVRSMLSADKWYPEGKLHVLPLLNLSLPGIDPNDFKKCLVTFQMISTFVSLVAIVDCSEANNLRSDLTETERELCSATAQFEDFVLQFVDRVFVLIENSAQEQVHGDVVRLNPEQTMVEIGLASTFTSVLQQCSTPIYMSALRRLHNFISSSVYESRVGGRFAANLVRAAAKVNPAAALKMFMNNICDNILNHIKSHESTLTDEQLDDSFLWNLLMFAQLVRCDGSQLVLYKDKLQEVLSSIMCLECIQGYEIAGQAVRYLLRALTLTYPLNYRSTKESLDRPLTEYLPIREWAKPGDVDDLGLDWHVPSAGEIQFAGELLDKLLKPELETVQKVTADSPIPKEELLRHLNNILECLNGAGAVMPMWKGEPIHIVESQVPLKRYSSSKKCGNDLEVTIDGGKNVRAVVADALRPLLNHMSACCEDDTKGFFRLLRIYEVVLFFTGAPKNDFDNRWKSFHVVKKALEDKMRSGKRHIRALLVDRVLLQHEMRSLNKTDKSFTEKHKQLQQDLFTLSVSRYSEVRKKAQQVLFQHFQMYPYSYRVLMDQLVDILRNKDAPEHSFQGALYVLLGNNKRNIATKRSWEVTAKIWPAIIQAQHSEKPSILNLIEAIVSKTVKNFESTAIKIQVNESSLRAAAKLLSSRSPNPSCTACSVAELKAGATFEMDKNIHNQKLYESIVADIVTMVKDSNLTWRFCQIGLELLSLLGRHDTPIPVCAVQLIVQSCVHDSLTMRKLALQCLSAIQKQQKRAHKKIQVDPLTQGSGTTPAAEGGFRPGDRPDNAWHVYNSKDIPDTQEKWEALVPVEKTHWGYYTWPKTIATYAPRADQPKLQRTRDELTDGEQAVYDAFISQQYVDKLIDFLALEENKNKDKFSNKNMTLFKGLFRNYGDTFLPLFQKHIARLISDTSHDKHDTSQRCAMELLAGLLRGSKHWAYTQTKALWEWAVPLLRTALNNLTVSTLTDWSHFFTHVSESRDPRKIYWYFELLMDNPINDEGGSFGDAGRLCMVQSALLQQEWRVSDLVQRLVTYLQPYVAHPYKNVRDRIGSLLSNVFMLDYQMFSGSVSNAPSRKQFLHSVLPQLDRLKDLVIEEAQHQNGGNGESSPSEPLETAVEGMEIDNNTEETEERKSLVRLCKTVMKCMCNCISRTFNTAPEDIFPLLPILCTLESESKDEELKTDCKMALACMSQALLQPEVVPTMLHTVKETIGLASWHTRAACLSYIQVMVFCNFFTLNNHKHQLTIRETVMHLLCDDKLEVREMASITLSGLLQCGYLNMDQDMLDHFEKMSLTKIKKNKKTDSIPMEKIIQRHAGVLGLSAYVQAYPYDVPEHMPQILMDLSDHVNDPQPIQMSVKKTLSNFRRTHHDNWHDHKLMFTDDQLVILTDLLVSPNYYA